jgi:hypothetical protein
LSIKLIGYCYIVVIEGAAARGSRYDDSLPYSAIEKLLKFLKISFGYRRAY